MPLGIVLQYYNFFIKQQNFLEYRTYIILKLVVIFAVIKILVL